MAPQEATAPKPFRVIVVGAGIVGIALSHSLQLAGIDHVVLEKHKEVVSIRGSALILWPNGARILDQFGILPRTLASGRPVQREFRRWPDGSVQYEGTSCKDVGEQYVACA